MIFRRKVMFVLFVMVACLVNITNLGCNISEKTKNPPASQKRLLPPASEAEALKALSSDDPRQLITNIISLNAQKEWPLGIPRDKICARIANLLEASDKSVLRSAIVVASPHRPLDFIHQRENGLDELIKAMARFEDMRKPGDESFLFYRNSDGKLIYRHILSSTGDEGGAFEYIMPDR